MDSAQKLKLRTLGQLRASGYKPKSIKDEMRENLMNALRMRKPVFSGIKGYEDTVMPQIETAILSKHNILLLGLRGQAKTKLARLMVNLLDEYIPVVKGSEINDDPLNPISIFAKELIKNHGEDTPIEWMHRNERYTEKLATPDVSVSDLIGDVDPIKAANQKLTYADERVIHFGLIPRSHRCIFVINELPDLQPRIQVALFNILQEGDVQIRGFKFRLPLDVKFIFTANPEDYTKRGSIITPLKDRIDSQILTHYPKTIEISQAITEQEAQIAGEQKSCIYVHNLIKTVTERISFMARESEYVDQKSGVSARMTISAYETLYSTAERRMLIHNKKKSFVRFSDIYGVVPSITGKIELVYEGETEGIANVASYLIGRAFRHEFEKIFPNPEKIKKSKQLNPYQSIIAWFNEGHHTDILSNSTDEEYAASLRQVPGLEDYVKKIFPTASATDTLLYMEFLLHGLSEFSQISKQVIEKGIQFKDLLGSLLGGHSHEDGDDELYRDN
ncbi:MAG: AAA family ATPase [Cytophagaceae bacterium]|nr:AAA family ATPase [Cytophagaceae bacterium]MDW8455153.1 AAA family ATPase [Cytophagaceae bacterium]